MKKLTISVSGGKVAWQHDKRLSHSANVSPALSKYNIVIKDCDDLKTEFNDFFAPFVQAYNEKQKRKDRQVKDYYKEIESTGRKESAAYEYVIQIGNRDTNPLVKRDKTGRIISWGDTTKDSVAILRQYAMDFEKNNPHFHVLLSAIHVDEVYTKDSDGNRISSTGCPHLHIIYTPFADGYKQKLSTRCSHTKALEQMGFKYSDAEKTEAKVLWKRAQESLIEKMMAEKGIEREYAEGRTERIANGMYQKIRANMEKELSGLSSEISSAKDKVKQIDPLMKELSDALPERDIVDVKRNLNGLKLLTDYEQAQFTTHNNPEISKRIIKERAR